MTHIAMSERMLFLPSVFTYAPLLEYFLFDQRFFQIRKHHPIISFRNVGTGEENNVITWKRAIQIFA